ncbi:MAG: hypothetical protein ACPKPY_09765 [Nitrososphaeraceae archaeon]
MTKLSYKEQQILKYIIINCEIYHFNEDESLQYLENHFTRPISRRTYYKYKKQIYKKHEENSPYFGLLKLSCFNNKSRSSWNSISLMREKENMIQEGLINNISLEEFDNVDHIPTYLEKLYDRTGGVIEHAKEFINRIETRRKEVAKKSKLIPDNATIRKEYVKCNKEFCLRCPHGPYYYAYWRDNKSNKRKLKKKYLGTSCPILAQNKKN